MQLVSDAGGKVRAAYGVKLDARHHPRARNLHHRQRRHRPPRLPFADSRQDARRRVARGAALALACYSDLDRGHDLARRRRRRRDSRRVVTIRRSSATRADEASPQRSSSPAMSCRIDPAACRHSCRSRPLPSSALSSRWRMRRHRSSRARHASTISVRLGRSAPSMRSPLAWRRRRAVSATASTRRFTCRGPTMSQERPSQSTTRIATTAAMKTRHRAARGSRRRPPRARRAVVPRQGSRRSSAKPLRRASCRSWKSLSIF